MAERQGAGPGVSQLTASENEEPDFQKLYFTELASPAYDIANLVLKDLEFLEIQERDAPVKDLKKCKDYYKYNQQEEDSHADDKHNKITAISNSGINETAPATSLGTNALSPVSSSGTIDSNGSGYEIVPESPPIHLNTIQDVSSQSMSTEVRKLPYLDPNETSASHAMPNEVKLPYNNKRYNTSEAASSQAFPKEIPNCLYYNKPHNTSEAASSQAIPKQIPKLSYYNKLFKASEAASSQAILNEVVDLQEAYGVRNRHMRVEEILKYLKE